MESTSRIYGTEKGSRTASVVQPPFFISWGSFFEDNFCKMGFHEASFRRGFFLLLACDFFDTAGKIHHSFLIARIPQSGIWIRPTAGASYQVKL